MDHSNEIVVVGAANVDIGGKPDQKLIPRDSNLGHVTVSLGGVGRNIAHNLSLLGCHVTFLSAIGEDTHARHIIESCRELSVNTEECLWTADAPTSTYLFILRDDGDMELAISDMGIVDYLTPAFFEKKMDVINRSALVVVDANIPAESIQYILNHATVPVFAETVSCKKAEKFLPVLDRIHTITPNALEAEILIGESIDMTSEASLARAAEAFLQKGVRQVIITLGPKGAYYANGEVRELIPPLPSRMISGNGAGDALISGVAAGYVNEYGFSDCVMLGMAAASMTLETAATNHENLSFSAILKKAGI